MIDGKGLSNAWNPYWKQCGICHPDLMPQYILHMSHFKEDAKVTNYNFKQNLSNYGLLVFVLKLIYAKVCHYKLNNSKFLDPD